MVHHKKSDKKVEIRTYEKQKILYENKIEKFKKQLSVTCAKRILPVITITQNQNHKKHKSVTCELLIFPVITIFRLTNHKNTIKNLISNKLKKRNFHKNHCENSIQNILKMPSE